jgi:hypothetical protein
MSWSMVEDDDCLQKKDSGMSVEMVIIHKKISFTVMKRKN